MTGFREGSVVVEIMALSAMGNLTTDVNIHHKGDSTWKTIPFREFTHHNFVNTSRWLHSHGIPEELHWDQICCEVAQCKWWSLEFKKRAIYDILNTPNNY